MDRETVIRAQAGDQEAFTRLAAALTPGMLSSAHRILRDIGAAEDATQRAMLDMWRGLPRLRDPERFEAWSVPDCLAGLFRAPPIRDRRRRAA